MSTALAPVGAAAAGGELILHAVRIQVRLTPDGGLAGDAGGYQPIDNALGVSHIGGPGVASVAGLDCASVRKTLRLLADGDRDPKSGQCASISTAMKFEATPAFVFENGRLVGAPMRRVMREAQR